MQSLNSAMRSDQSSVEPITLENTELVIFDCDGVLIDSEPIASSTMAKTLEDFGVTMSAADAHRIFTGNSESDTRVYCRNTLGIEDVDAFFAAWGKHLYEGFKAIKPMAGVSDIVTALNRPVCVASNSTLHRLTRSLGRTDLWMSFHGQVFSADHVTRPKPAPDLVLHCANELGVDPARCIMIDDSAHGVQSAVAAGMIAVGFVDPNDPRPGRADALGKAGAHFVAFGAGELRSCLESADKWLARLSENIERPRANH
jgi:beta-phosphoglucomutase-like phosphatase (HAD superfamily)